MGVNDGWTEVTDPAQASRVSQMFLPTPPPNVGRGKGGAGGISPQDRVALAKYRDDSNAADTITRNAAAFEARAGRFHTGAGKAAIFGAMYPDTDGALGGLKAAGGAALRGTLGYLYPDQDHADYQYLQSRVGAINNGALRLEKGVQTKSDEARIGRENLGVDKTPAVNHDIAQSMLDNAAIAHARSAAAAKWVANFQSLAGTKNTHGQTYEDWFNQVVAPQALAHARAQRAPQAPQGSGWYIERVR